jgi:hypothetical protein
MVGDDGDNTTDIQNKQHTRLLRDTTQDKMTTYYVTFPDKKTTYVLPEGETLPPQMIQNFEMMGVLYSTEKPDGWDDEYDGDSSDEEETDYCNGCDRDVPADTMFNHDDINLCPECNTKKPELIPVGCECERCEDE